MTELKIMDGHVFTPSLQDISLKRFRMRYCPLSDGYYLHWDNKLGEHLARIKGLENGVHNMFGVQRFISEEGDMSYLSVEEPEVVDSKTQSVGSIESKEKMDHQHDSYPFPPSISWKFDFEESGLAIKSIQIKASVKQLTEDDGLCNPEDIDTEPVTFQITGDKDSMIDDQIYLGDYYTEIPVLKGSKSVVLTAQLQNAVASNASTFFLPSSNQRFETPLDIVINLMCLRREEWPFVGEILLGMKYSESGASESLKEKPDISVECGVMGGQLQVHIVEGAGLVKEGTKKAYNSFVKCRFLPDQQNSTMKQTSPKHNAYPTWTKEFIFAGIDKYDLVHGGIELLLYDHHKFFSNSLIGGIRLSQPLKITRDPTYRFSTGSTLPTFNQPLSRETSPVQTLATPGTPGPTIRTSFLDIMNAHKLSASQPDLLSIDSTNDRSSSPHTHFATINSNNGNRPSNLTISPVASPLLRRVPVFTLPTRDSPTPPFGSPKLLRKNHKSPKLSLTMPHTVPSESGRAVHDEVIYSWMDSTRNEVTHWKKVLNNPGEWVYCWHIIRPKITPA